MNADSALRSVRERFPLPALLAVLLVALVGRMLLLLSNSVSFHSDEAVVALMARHILQGERPVFFYGQAYMGSLDAWLVAVGFRLFGESVSSIRVVQSALYLAVVALGFTLGWRVSGRVVVATVAGLTLAVPPVLVATYTTATLGGYNETLSLGTLMLILAYDVTHEYRRSWWRWALLGLCGGLGWWSNGLIIAFGLPAALLIAYRTVSPSPEGGRGHDAQPHQWRMALVGIAIAAVCFFIGGAPWWVFNFENDFAALNFLTGRADTDTFAGDDAIPIPLEQRVIGLFLLGLPTLVGLRFPWLPTYFAPLVGLVVALLYLLAVYRLARVRPSSDASGRGRLRPDGRLLILGMLALFCALFFVSRFSIDPTGRYFLPLALPLGVVLGTLVDALSRRAARVALLVLVLGYFAAGQLAAATGRYGLTTQFNLDTHIPNTHDAELIDFLLANDLTRGYTNYWISFRLAFLSGERLQYSAAFSYKRNLDYTPADERYPAYRAAADSAERVAYITANVAEIEAALVEAFAAEGVIYSTAQIGPYTIFHDFQPAVPRPPLPGF